MEPGTVVLCGDSYVGDRFSLFTDEPDNLVNYATSSLIKLIVLCISDTAGGEGDTLSDRVTKKGCSRMHTPSERGVL